jgi:hypothetical protein
MARKFRENNIVIGVFSHPEYYPPTLNAIHELSKIFDNVYVLSRNVLESKWDYPSNVQLVVSGKYCTIRESEQKNFIQKFFSFFYFTFHLFKLIRKTKPTYIQVCDTIPLFSLFLIKIVISKKIKIWYHNHDVCEIKLCRKFSIGWFAVKYESKMFPFLDIFTLPSEDRKKFFSMEKLNGHYYLLPNFPAKKHYNDIINNYLEDSPINLIYQGSVGPGHGLEFICSLLDSKIDNKKINLNIIGAISPMFYEELIEKLPKKKYIVNVITYGQSPYSELVKYNIENSIGIAILEPNNINYKYAGTASNKIYEYAAKGIPILYFDNEYYNNYLIDIEWAFPVKLEKESILNAIKKIFVDYKNLSDKAKIDFDQKLNYESYFQKINIININNILE